RRVTRWEEGCPRRTFRRRSCANRGFHRPEPSGKRRRSNSPSYRLTRRMKVYLVGAGPGDPGLITVKGKKILERADAVLFDNLASERLLEHAPASAEK